MIIIAACGGGADGDTTTTAEAGQQTTASTDAGEETTTTAEEQMDEFDAEAYFGQRGITVVVTHSVGGGSDVMARVFANSLSGLLPGQPRVTVTNVNGVEGMDLVYNAPEGDIFIGATSQGSGLFEPLLDPEVTFDPTGVRMIGGVVGDPRASIGVNEYPEAYASLLDAQGGGDVALRAAFEAGAPADVVAEVLLTPWLCDAFELTCEMFVISADSTSDQVLMMERGEVNFNVSSLGSIAREHNDDIISGDSIVYFTFDDEGTDVIWPEGLEVPPNLLDILPAEALAQFEVIRPLVTSGGIGKNYYVGPSVPDEAVEVLRQAWDAFIADDALYADYERLGGGGGEPGGVQLPVTPLSGAEAQDIYSPQAANFVENLEQYIPIQEDIFARYYAG